MHSCRSHKDLYACQFWHRSHDRWPRSEGISLSCLQSSPIILEFLSASYLPTLSISSASSFSLDAAMVSILRIVLSISSRASSSGVFSADDLENQALIPPRLPEVFKTRKEIPKIQILFSLQRKFWDVHTCRLGLISTGTGAHLQIVYQ